RATAHQFLANNVRSIPASSSAIPVALRYRCPGMAGAGTNHRCRKDPVAGRRANRATVTPARRHDRLERMGGPGTVPLQRIAILGMTDIPGPSGYWGSGGSSKTILTGTRWTTLT